jgi:hypothetical protein
MGMPPFSIQHGKAGNIGGAVPHIDHLGQGDQLDSAGWNVVVGKEQVGLTGIGDAFGDGVEVAGLLGIGERSLQAGHLSIVGVVKLAAPDVFESEGAISAVASHLSKPAGDEIKRDLDVRG